MRRHPFRRLIVVAAAAALTLSACGGGTETAAGDGYVSPIGEFLGDDQFFGFSGDFSDEDQARMIEEERKREEAVALCMKEQGFDYIPRDTSDFLGGFGVEEGLEFGSREYAEKYGFGISTQRYSQSEVGPELVGWNDGPDGPGGSPEDDPNFEIMESLDESTRQAYQEALYGDQDDFGPDIDPETMSEEELQAAEEEFFENYEPTGCMNESYADIGPSQFFNEFSDEIEDMYEAVQDDPRVQGAYDEVNECLAEKGFEAIDLDTGPWEEFETELQEVDELVGGFPGEDLTEADFAEMSEEELDAMFNQPREFSADAKAKLAEVQEREIAYALASFDCGGNFVEPPEVFLEVLAEYEQRFLDDNADRLQEFKDSQEGA